MRSCPVVLGVRGAVETQGGHELHEGREGGHGRREEASGQPLQNGSRDGIICSDTLETAYWLPPRVAIVLSGRRC